MFHCRRSARARDREPQTLKILVAGGTGLVGSALLPMLAKTHAVHALTRSPRSGDAIQWHLADLSAPAGSWSLPERWDATIYLAQSAAYREFPDRAADMVAVNVQGPIALLEASRRRGATRFVLASTASVYGPSLAPLDEQAPLNPSTFYARTRHSAEVLAEPFGVHLDVTVARLFTVYGPGQRPDTLIASLIDRVGRGTAVQVKGERGLLLSPIYLSDAADALRLLVERPATSASFRIVNVGGCEALDLGELAARIGRAVGRAPVIERQPGDEPGGWIADTRLLQSLTPWSPSVTLEDGLQLAVAARAV